MTQITILIIMLVAFSIIFLIDIFSNVKSSKSNDTVREYKNKISDLKTEINMLKIEIGLLQHTNNHSERLINILGKNNERNSD